ncbi:DNA polymerase III subunit delta' [Acinetobacter nectaris]|uniref:DNA polymerase III subunit delta' n=1 Tax=Acinetobacter nectaris TaxID=1219382 RepID=UPI001F465DD5|nr:DNA polymerase III subunit delta' [Acinetobacter nectaris]MCF8998108.1 DNA polymerase III subunit delta' [Acinetobacter nectaris]MCF9026966.1 DNA polymerase III subunit delta' [Acinetobacter nectaris]
MSENFFKQTEVYPWQQPVWDMLVGRFPNVGHGLLFYGKSGAGKLDFVQHFVAWVLCLDKQQHGACGKCVSCQWLKSGTHPNYVYISNDEESKKNNNQIKIEKIRDLQPFVQQTVDGWRVVVIQPADALNIASANALLKTLEEPGERVLIILVTQHFLKLPATIRSRLQRYALDRISMQDAKTYMQKQDHSLGEQQVNLLLNLSNDMPLQALHLKDETWVMKRQLFLDDWTALVETKNMLMKYSTKWSKELNFVEFEQMFDYLLSDLVAFKLGQKIRNIDLDFQKIATYYTLEQLFNIYQALQKAKHYTQQNVQTHLIIDDLFVLLLNVK